MAAFSVTNPYGALTLAVNILASGGTETQLAAGAFVVAFVDELNRGRKYNPLDWGYTPTTGDAASKWLPSVGTITPATAPDGSGNVGTYRITLIPGTGDQVNVASVQTIVVDRNALFVVATGTF